MQKSIGLIVFLMAGAALSGCTPLVVGGAAVVVADEIIEQDQGGDGLF